VKFVTIMSNQTKIKKPADNSTGEGLV